MSTRYLYHIIELGIKKIQSYQTLYEFNVNDLHTTVLLVLHTSAKLWLLNEICFTVFDKPSKLIASF